MKLTIYWDMRHVEKSKAKDYKQKIIDKFNLPCYTTVNGETPCEVRDEDMDLLRECEKRGFIQIRNKTF